MTVTAPGIAAQHPPDRLCQAFEQSVLLQGEEGVLATTGSEAAVRREGWRDVPSIEPNRPDDGRDKDSPEDGWFLF